MATARAQGGLRESDGFVVFPFFFIFFGPGKKSTFLRDVFDGPPKYYRDPGPEKVKSWPLGIVSHTVWRHAE